MSEKSIPATSRNPDTAQPESVPRRNMLVQVVTTLISIVLVAVPATLGGLFFLDPILRRRQAAKRGDNAGRKDAEGFIRLNITREIVPADGTPVSFTVTDDMSDAWNQFRDVPVGSIWLRKVGDGPILAFNSICPHLGCSVDFRRAQNDFFCPCHTSSFSLDGEKTNEVPPRDMDSLEVSMRTNGKEDPAGNEIWVRYQKFRGATAEKIPIS
jgi:menaquinol-cytochrome c reductase iron-sulfur subunit